MPGIIKSYGTDIEYIFFLLFGPLQIPVYTPQGIYHATGVEEDPTATQNIRCLWRGGRVALIQIK